MFAEMVRDHLSQYTMFTTHIFNTGEDCLKNLHELPDLIILDYHLNDVYKEAADGLAILEKIKKGHPNATVIMLSSQGKYTVAAQTISKGAIQYVVKDEQAFQNISRILESIF
jgi:DNA-binding NtrC family response regulator